MTLHSGERQVAPTIAGIRRDHVARYEWAANILWPLIDVSNIDSKHQEFVREANGISIFDAGCGCGYGSAILADAGHMVIGIDANEEAIEYTQKHYGRESITYRIGDLRLIRELEVVTDAAVCFETIEHLRNPGPFLLGLRCERLLASVPNQAIYSFAGQAGHYRHYTKAEFAELLNICGWFIRDWYTQDGPQAEVRAGDNGWTLIVDARRG